MGGKSREFGIWSCNSCFIICHHRCITAWVARERQYHRRSGSHRPFRWSCLNVDCEEWWGHAPASKCWCGSLSSDGYEYDDNAPNSCRGPCRKIGRCQHSNPANPCERLCHPGPCDLPCRSDCDQVSNEMAMASMSAWQRFRRRWIHRQDKTVSHLVVPAIVVILFYIALLTFLPFFISWKTQPLYAHKFTEKGWGYSKGTWLCLPLAFGTVFNAALLLWFSVQFGRYGRPLLGFSRYSPEKLPAGLRAWAWIIGSKVLFLSAAIIPILL